MVQATYSTQTTQPLPIVETFHSIQGEGHWTGCSAFVIRLAGCDVGCSWCDTKHSWDASKTPICISALIEEVCTINPFMVLITGGEPLMHNLAGLTAALKANGHRVHLETSGSHGLTGHFDWITLSPKRAKPPLESIYSQCHELKIVIADPADFTWAEQQRELAPHAIACLQPEWSAQNQQMIIDYIKANPHWRLSLQTHKYLKVR